jgi:hypothetical protein
MTAPTAFARALALLVQSYRYTQELGCSPWDFAVELPCLREAGLTNSDVRWLLSKQYVVQGVETIPPPEGDSRAFTPLSCLALDARSCFILTDEGIGFALGEGATPEPAPTADGSLPNGRKSGPVLPSWEKDRRTLFFRDQVVKHYKVPAPNQELILTVFQEERWTYRIDDPLPTASLIDRKQRLHDAIGSLNRNQRQPLIRFHGDGSGEGICWEPCAAGTGPLTLADEPAA